MSDGEPHDEIARLEAQIERLADTIEGCRKIVLVSRFAFAAGALVLLSLLFGVIRFDPVIMMVAVAGLLGGIVAFGSNTSTAKQALDKMSHAEALRAELIGRLVHSEALRNSSSAFDQNSTRATAVDRMEIHAVLDFRGVRVTELFVDALLLGELLIAFDFERHVMGGSRAENPATRRTIRLMKQRDGFRRATLAYFEVVVRAFLSGFPKSKRVDEKSLRLGNLAH